MLAFQMYLSKTIFFEKLSFLTCNKCEYVVTFFKNSKIIFMIQVEEVVEFDTNHLSKKTYFELLQKRQFIDIHKNWVFDRLRD